MGSLPLSHQGSPRFSLVIYFIDSVAHMSISVSQSILNTIFTYLDLGTRIESLSTNLCSKERAIWASDRNTRKSTARSLKSGHAGVQAQVFLGPRRCVVGCADPFCSLWHSQSPTPVPPLRAGTFEKKTLQQHKFARVILWPHEFILHLVLP